MGHLGFRERRQLKREIRRDLVELRRLYPELSDEEFEAKAEAYIREEYEGIDPDNLKLILEFLKEVLPLILSLFGVLLLCLFVMPERASAEPPMFVGFATAPVMAGEADAATTLAADVCVDGSCGPVRQTLQAISVRATVERIRARQPVRGFLSAVRSRSLGLRCRGGGCR